jgi:hypothetical protein
MSEPCIIDYYNDYPQIISVIDKLNELKIILLEIAYQKKKKKKKKKFSCF